MRDAAAGASSRARRLRRATGSRARATRPASLPPFPADQPRNRLGLARWLTDRSNPLAARVVVNRIWRMHFGRGIVATPEDFGSQGRLPTHPELLDWLGGAVHGRRMGREGAAPADRDLARRSGSRRTAPASAAARDPGQPAARARAEAAAAGRSNPRQRARGERPAERTIGGPSVKPYQPAGLWEQSGTGQDLQAGHGRQALSPQPLHVLAAHVAAAVDDHLRRDVARGLHGQARRHDDAAAVAGAAERSAVRRSRARAGRARVAAISGRWPRRGTARRSAPWSAGRRTTSEAADTRATVRAKQQAIIRAATPMTAAKLLAVGESQRGSRAATRRIRGDDDRRERDHELRRVRRAAVRRRS